MTRIILILCCLWLRIGQRIWYQVKEISQQEMMYKFLDHGFNVDQSYPGDRESLVGLAVWVYCSSLLLTNREETLKHYERYSRNTERSILLFDVRSLPINLIIARYGYETFYSGKMHKGRYHSALHLAVVKNNVGIVKYLIQRDADLDSRTSPEEGLGSIPHQTPLHIAVENNNV